MLQKLYLSSVFSFFKVKSLTDFSYLKKIKHITFRIINPISYNPSNLNEINNKKHSTNFQNIIDYRPARAQTAQTPLMGYRFPNNPRGNHPLAQYTCTLWYFQHGLSAASMVAKVHGIIEISSFPAGCSH